MSETAGLAEVPASRLDKAMNLVPRALASKAHIIFLGGLLVYLVLLPLTRVYTPSSSAMLVGGNWCNVTSDIGACIAAGGTVALLSHSRKRNRLAEATHRITADLYRFHTGQAHPDAPQPAGGPR
jgi:predicted phage tail protein